MSQEEIVEIDESTNKLLSIVNQTLQKINKFFIYTLILKIPLEKDDDIVLTQVCDFLSDNAFALKEKDNEIVRYFRDLEYQFDHEIEDYSKTLLPSDEILKSWATLRAICDRMNLVIAQNRDAIKRKVPTLPYPFRGLVTKLNSAEREAEKSSACIVRLVRKLTRHDLKAEGYEDSKAFEKEFLDKKFNKLTESASQNLSPIMQKLDESTILEFERTWPKDQLKKFFLDFFSEPEIEESPFSLLFSPDFSSENLLAEEPENVTTGSQIFNRQFIRFYVISIILAVTLDWESSESAFENLCKKYLKAVKVLPPNRNVIVPYLEELEKQVNQAVKENPEQTIAPMDEITIHLGYTKTFSRLLGDVIEKSYNKIKDNSLSSGPECTELLSYLRTSYEICSSNVNRIENIMQTLLSHNDRFVKTVPTEEEDVALHTLYTADETAEGLVGLQSLFIQDMADYELDQLQKRYYAKEAKDFDTEFFKPIEIEDDDPFSYE